jgi:hypothetical protein
MKAKSNEFRLFGSSVSSLKDSTAGRIRRSILWSTPTRYVRNSIETMRIVVLATENEKEKEKIQEREKKQKNKRTKEQKNKRTKEQKNKRTNNERTKERKKKEKEKRKKKKNKKKKKKKRVGVTSFFPVLASHTCELL